MTGNNKFWRASLAGLASVAMLATMGVAASTANAAGLVPSSGFATTGNFTVVVYGKDDPYKTLDRTTISNKAYGEVVDLSNYDPYINDDGKVLDYFSTDLAGKNKVSTEFPITGDVKLFAQYKDAVTVTFDTNNSHTADANDAKVKIAKGSSLTAADYAAAADSQSYDLLTRNANGDVDEFGLSDVNFGEKTFVGWTYTKNTSNSADDLYEGQPITADTTLYQRTAQAQNVATVAFRQFGNDPVASPNDVRYTLNGHVLPAYRALTSFTKDANGTAVDGTWNDGAFTEAVSAGKNIGPKYWSKDNWDKTVTFTPASASPQNVTVKIDLNEAESSVDRNTFGKKDIATTSDQKLAKPADPALDGYVFTGWYLKRAADGQSVAYDFNKTVGENFKDAKGTYTLYAGWDNTNVSRLVFNLDYKTYPTAQIVEYVYPGSEVTLPAGLEEYYQTEAQSDALKGEYTPAKLTGWKYGSDTVTKLTAPKAYATTFLDAVWSVDASYLLDANGGKFADGTASQWVTIADGSALSFPTPTREGFTFAAWQDKTSGKVLNLADGQLYDYNDKFQNYFDINSKATGTLTPGASLKALWWSADVQVTKATYDFNGVLKYENVEKDYAAVEAAGYTADSAKKFVDAQYALRDDYAAYTSLTDGSQKKIDAAKKLNAKYADAKALLVKADVPVVPTPAEKVAVYRAYNPGLPQVAQHLYTTNVEEYNERVANDGWIGEGIVFYTTSDKTAAPVYRLYNQYTSEHFLTSDKAEYEDLYQNKGWTNEGIAWYIPADGTADLFRLQNPVSFEHLYTTNAEEKDNLTANAGWVLEGAPYKVYAK